MKNKNHSNLLKEVQQDTSYKRIVTDNLTRFLVGIEEDEDLINDINKVLL